MITEFLTSSDWLNPQIDYLLFLQNLREQSGGIFDSAFLSLTKLGELLFPTLAMCIVYWCIDFRAGMYLFAVNNFTLIFAQLFKSMACIYRPWVLSDKIHPSALAIKHAGGYSFPSGHSMMASSVWGAMAYWVRKKPLLCGFFVFITLLVAFSRNYLGVHTPQDVVIGLLTGYIFVFVFDKIINWCEKDLNRYIYLLIFANIFAISVLFYIVTKSYPMDYIDGKLLANPQKAISIAVMYIGWILGILNGVFLCRRFFPFDAKKGTVPAKIVRALIGIVTSCVLFSIIEKYIFTNLVSYKISMIITFCVGFYMTAIYPLIFSKLFKKYL